MLDEKIYLKVGVPYHQSFIVIITQCWNSGVDEALSMVPPAANTSITIASGLRLPVPSILTSRMASLSGNEQLECAQGGLHTEITAQWFERNFRKRPF